MRAAARPAAVALWMVGLFFGFAACSPDASEGYGPDSEVLFSIDQLMEVDLTIEPGDWDRLRFEPPGLDHYLDPDCPNGPRPRPFNWYPATASVNGEDFGEIEVRKKGLKGSMNPAKTSLKLKFRKEAVPHGIRRMTLNNSVQDPSFSHECMTYHLYEKADLAAPRCGLAKVTVNGELLGVYTHIEEIKPPLLEYRFGDGSGDLFEITMADFVPEMLVMFEPKNDALVDLEQLGKVAQALELGDGQLFDELEKYIELDEFFSYWAMEVITAHADGYTGNRNNSYVYRHPKTLRYHFIPWGTDSSFGRPGDFFGQFIGDFEAMPWSVYAHGALARRLLAHPQGRERYEVRLRSLLDEVWDEDRLLDMVDTIKWTVTPKLSGIGAATCENAAEEVRGHIQAHRQRILDELDQGLSEWNRDVRPPLCVEINQTFNGVLRTTFDTLNADLMETGEGQAFETNSDGTTELAMVRGVLGQFDDPADNSQVLLILGIGPASNSKALILQIVIPAAQFVQGNSLPTDFGMVLSDVGWVDLLTYTMTAAGFVANGQLTLDKIDTTSGGEIEITFEAPLAVFRL